MNTLNEKVVVILNAVIKEIKLEGTYDALYLSDSLSKFWDNCLSFASGFTQDEIDDIRFDAVFEGMMKTIKSA